MMAKQKQEEPKKQVVETKENIYDLAEKLGLKRENVEEGMKKNPEKTAEMIEKAYAFKFKGK
jgi:hypothetical protein